MALGSSYNSSGDRPPNSADPQLSGDRSPWELGNLDDLLQSIPVGVLFSDRLLTLQRFTPTAAQFFSLTEQDLQHSILRIAHYLNCKNLEQLLRQVLETEQPVEQTVTLTATGDRLLMRLQPYRRQSGSCDGVVLTFLEQVLEPASEPEPPPTSENGSVMLAQVDVNPIQRAFQRRTNDLDQLYASIPLGMGAFDENRRCIWANDLLAQIDGYLSGTEQIGKTIEELVPHLADKIIPLHRRVMETGETILNREFSCEESSHPGQLRIWLTNYYPLTLLNSRRVVGLVMVDVTPFKQAELELRRSQTLRDAIFNESTDALILVDVATQQVVDCNPRATELFETDRQHLLQNLEGAYLTQLCFNPVDESTILAAIAQQDHWRGEVACRTFQNRMFWGDLAIKRIVVAEQPIDLISITDITARKQAEQVLQDYNQTLENQVQERIVALRESEERLRLALSAANQGLYDINLLTEEVIVSPEYAQMLGYDPLIFQETLASWRDRLHPEDRDRVLQAYEEYVTEQRPNYQVSFRLQTRTGDWKWIYSIGRMIAWTEQAQPLRMIGTHTDITAQKQIEIALQASEERFRLAARAAAGIVYDWDFVSGSIYRSEGLYEVMGYHPDEVPAEANWWTEQIHPDDREKAEQIFQEITANLGDRYNLEYRLRHRDGRWVDIWDQGYIIRDEQRQIQRIVGFSADISDRKQAQIALEIRARELAQLNQLLIQTTTNLEQRNRELDQFAYVASHDLKAPLRGIQTLSDWLIEDLSRKLSETNTRHLRLLKKQANRMQNLVDGLLRYSRVGREQTNPEPVSVAELLQDIIDSLSPVPGLIVHIHPPMPIINARRILLEQVFSNLLSNAIKYSDRPECEIIITATDEGDYYRFSVNDNGPGIAPQFHQKIFGIFETLQPRDKTESTGIGLSIVKKIIEMEGGTIAVDSVPGEGATFHFTWLK